MPDSIRWEWAARTTVDDLPDDLMFVDITESGLLVSFLGALISGGDPARVGEELGVEISTLEAVRHDPAQLLDKDTRI